jgi:transposase
MPPKKRIPRDELEDLVERGYKLKHLAEHFGCDISTIKARIEEYGIEFQPKFSEKITIPKREIIRKIKEGKTFKEIAKEFGVSYSTLLKRAKEYGIDYWETRIPRDELRMLLNKKMSVPEIANWFGVSQKTVESRIKRYGLQRPNTKRDTSPKTISRELLYHWYVEEGLSIDRIANELEVSDSTVYKYLKKYNIPLRSRKICPDPKKEDIEALYYGQNLTFHETAKKLGIGSERLASLMKKYGIKPKPKSKRRYSDEEILDELRKAVTRYGGIPTQKELRYDDEFGIDVKTVTRRFGSWKIAVSRLQV